ncbi:uncharacterized protein LOC111319657 [Stylophora pistillata]|uniref:CARD domain-containing protein n=1 Tax=Stylophora pistillata TaxID=50429 RepID=A0A2B4T0I5_STYPI|nr:uncharacterized protein LOC111319657 [Stylophora pistillata]PFX34919.1 hypothetical protein AWC38_SpisGene59 [Stylophora pistillata]
MEESHRKVLRKFRLHISRNIDARRITEVLFTNEILDEASKELILAETTSEGKAFYLLDVLSRCGPGAFESFLAALHGSGRSFLANEIHRHMSGEQPCEDNERRPRSVGLPRKVPNFVGRMDICEEITRLLTTDEDDTTCLVTVVAPPGFGKTALAKAVGNMILSQGKKDVIYMCLRSVSSLTCAAELLLEEAVGTRADQQDAISMLKRYLTSLQKPTVLILDNAEDLQAKDESDFYKLLKNIGDHAKTLVTLITSRTPISTLELWPFATRHFPLRPLANEDSLLFLKNCVPNISNQRAKEFGIACHGIPLLLNITASFLKKKTVNSSDLHRKLQNCPHNFLKGKSQKIQVLNSHLKVFYNNLQPEMKKALGFLASFPKLFTKEEAKDVLFPTEDFLDFQYMLDTLEQHSLLQLDEVNNQLYYSLHPLVQAFCRSSMEETCREYSTAIKLFSRHYLAVLQDLSEEFIGTDCRNAIEKYHNCKTNIIHALVASVEDCGDQLERDGLSVSTNAVNFLAKVLNIDEFMSVYSQCLKAAVKLNDNILHSECLVSIGFKQLCYYGYKDAFHTSAKESLQQAHELQSELLISDTECVGHCKCKLGLCTVISGDKSKGISLIAQGIAIRKRRVRSDGSGKVERMLLAGGFCDLAMAMFVSGNLRAAINIWTNICLVRYRELLGQHPFTASLLHYLGDAHQSLGDLKRAVACKRESLEMRKYLLGDNHVDTARAYYGLGCALGALDSTEEALQNLKKAREIQIRFAASEQDIHRTNQEMNRLKGRVTVDLPGLVVQQMYI